MTSHFRPSRHHHRGSHDDDSMSAEVYSVGRMQTDPPLARLRQVLRHDQPTGVWMSREAGGSVALSPLELDRIAKALGQVGKIPLVIA